MREWDFGIWDRENLLDYELDFLWEWGLMVDSFYIMFHYFNFLQFDLK